MAWRVDKCAEAYRAVCSKIEELEEREREIRASIRAKNDNSSSSSHHTKSDAFSKYQSPSQIEVQSTGQEGENTKPKRLKIKLKKKT